MEKTDQLLTYLAGLWDGEGSFMLLKISRRSHGKQIPNSETNYDPCAQICMTINGRQEQIVALFKDFYGGVLHEVKDPPSKNKNGKPVLMWRGTCKKATELANDLLPYLMIKKRQAEIIIRFGELRAENRKVGGTIENSQKLERLQLVDEIHRLNHRGK